MFKLIEQVDLAKQISQEPELMAYLKQAVKQIEEQQSEQLSKFRKPVFDEDLQNHLIVTDIPDVKEEAKEDKFIAFFKNVLDKKGVGEKDGLESLELGYSTVNGVRVYNRTVYMIYKSAALSKKAYQKLHNVKFGTDILKCFTVKQFKDVQKITKEYSQPKLTQKSELVSYNFDERQRDQFMYTVLENNKLKLVLKWIDHIEKKVEEIVSIELAQGVKNVYFSSKGTYAAICEPNGVRVLGGSKLEEKGFYEHDKVTDVIFSPKQTFMITHNGSSEDTHQSFIIWALESEIKLHEHKALSHQTLASFQFNSDQSSLAIGLNNEFVVYRCDSVENLKKQTKLSEDQLVGDGKLIKAPNLQKLAWLPDRVSLTCVCYELNPSITAHPTSKIFSYNVETKQQKKWKAIGQNIKDAEITVSANGDWISVFFKKIQKKNLSVSVIYIVNLLKRQIETDIVEFKENVVSVSWDQHNGRFGVVYEIPSANKTEDVKFAVNFYQIQVKEKVQQAVKIGQIDMTPANSIILAQNGTFFALYNIDNFSWGKYKYSLGIFTRDQKTKKFTIELIKKNVQIPYMTYFNMDPSGRFILTGTDKAYQIWSIAGQLINKDMFSIKMSNARFRPRYATKLSADAENKLEEREKDIKKKYEQEDNKRLNAIEYEQKKEKEEKRNQFESYLKSKRAWFDSFRQARDKLRGFSQQDPKIKSAVYQHTYLQTRQ